MRENGSGLPQRARNAEPHIPMVMGLFHWQMCFYGLGLICNYLDIASMA